MNRIKTLIRNNKCLMCVEDYLALYNITWKDVKKLLELDENDNPLPTQFYSKNWDKYFYKEEISSYHGKTVNHYLIHHLIELVLDKKFGINYKKIDF